MAPFGKEVFTSITITFVAGDSGATPSLTKRPLEKSTIWVFEKTVKVTGPSDTSHNLLYIKEID